MGSSMAVFLSKAFLCCCYCIIAIDQAAQAVSTPNAAETTIPQMSSPPPVIGTYRGPYPYVTVNLGIFVASILGGIVVGLMFIAIIFLYLLPILRQQLQQLQQHHGYHERQQQQQPPPRAWTSTTF